MRHATIITCASALVLTLICSVPIAGQDNRTDQRSNAISIRVTEVPVDVTAVDGNGRPVTDLERADFVLFENGVEQSILHFAPVSYRSQSQLPGVVAGKEHFPAGIQPPEHRTFLIFVGRGRHYRVGALPKLIHFVKEQLAPADTVAVMAYNRASDFTTDHKSAARILEKYAQISPDIETGLMTRNTGLAAVYGRKTLLKPFQSRIDKMFAESGAASRRLVPDGASKQSARGEQDRDSLGESVLAESRDLAKTARESARLKEQQQRSTTGGETSGGGGHQVETPSEPEDYFDRMQLDLMTDGLPFDEFIGVRSITEQDVEQLYAAISYLRFMEGEKHLIYVSEDGLALPSLEDDQGLGRIASDARVRLHTIQTAGAFLTGGASDFEASFDSNAPRDWGGGSAPRQAWTGTTLKAFSLQSVQNISNMTGGTSFTRADIGQALETTDRMTSFFYLLGYVPSNRETKGEFRQIDVRIKRPGVRLYYRRGYFARDDWKTYDREQFMTYARTTAALGYDGQLQDVKFTLQANFEREGKAPEARVRIVTRLMPGAEVYEQAGDRHSGKLHVCYFVLSRKGHLVAEMSDDVTMSLSQQTYEKVMQEGLVLPKELAVEDKGEALLVKLIVYDPKNDRLGVGVVKVR
ncbi:MAG: VWA domain-containing protein [Acidobacteria bacterium]|nr:MAG: VWA domain-containing protein [Acidobacteriota bacterium]